MLTYPDYIYQPFDKDNINFRFFIDRNRKYFSPVKQQAIPIIASSPCRNTRNLKKEHFNSVVECGFNAGLFNSHPLTVINALKAVNTFNKEYGDDFQLICGATIMKQPALLYGITPLIKDKPYLGGYNLSDEPKFDDLDNLEHICQITESIDPDKLMFFNLNSSIVSDDKNNLPKDYDEFLLLVQNRLHPAMWSYDLYPIQYELPKDTNLDDLMVKYVSTISFDPTPSNPITPVKPTALDQNNSDSRETPLPVEILSEKKITEVEKEKLNDKCRYLLYNQLIEKFIVKLVKLKGFYGQLERFSRISYLTDRPFYAYCESMAYLHVETLPVKEEDKNKDKDKEDKGRKLNWEKASLRPMASVPTLRFQTFSPLGYGGQGLTFWTYLLRPQSGIIDGETYLSALANEYGDVNDYNRSSWEAARQVIKEIRKYEDVFLGAKLVRCSHIALKMVEYTNGIFPVGAVDRIKIHANESKDSDDDARAQYLQRKGVMVSHLINKGRDFIFVASHDPFEENRITIEFAKHFQIIGLTPTNPYDSYLDHEAAILYGNVLTYTLSPGGYSIFEFRAQ